jgi:hypothetical protein
MYNLVQTQASTGLSGYAQDPRDHLLLHPATYAASQEKRPAREESCGALTFHG